MEDFLIREIDRLGDMLMLIARRLGLIDLETPDYSLLDVKEEFEKNFVPLDLDAILRQENPVWYLVETEKLSEQALETFIDILFHSDLNESVKTALLSDALTYLDNKGYFSFKLHSLTGESSPFSS